jgi:hypothetical protein
MEQLRPLSRELTREAGEAAPLLPPQYCTPAALPITSAWRAEDPFGSCPQPAKGPAVSPGRRAGIRYQNKVIGHLSSLGTRLGGSLVPSPWFCYIDSGLKPRWCQPDFLIFSEAEDPKGQREHVLIIGEIKRVFHSDAWWQLERIYRPVVAAAFPTKQCISLCVCRSFDPAIPIPDPPHFISNVREAKAREFNVLVERI